MERSNSNPLEKLIRLCGKYSQYPLHLVGVFTFASISILYVATNRLSAWHGKAITAPWVDGIDGQIMIEWSIIPYILYYPLIIWSLLWFKNSKEEYAKQEIFVRQVWKLLLISSTIFIFLPTKSIAINQVNPDWIEGGGIFGMLWSTVHSLDEPTNAIPSLHVSLTLLIALDRQKRGDLFLLTNVGLWILCVLIIGSTVTTGQHHIFDLICGVILAIIVAKK